MKTTVTISEKKAFIQWLLKNHLMKSKEGTRILAYIANDERLLPRVHFVDDLTGVSRGLMLTACGMPQKAFLFLKQHIATSNAEKAFHDIRLHGGKELFIQLHFQQAHRSFEYNLVCESNPFAPLKISDADKKMVCTFLKEMESTFSQKVLLQKIDQALDNQNKKEFLRLSSLYNQEIKNKKKSGEQG